jgi:hypothetical protein
MIGPSVPEASAPLIINSCCESCTLQGRKLNISIYTSKYEEFRESKNYSRPDLAIAFNFGFHDTSTGWFKGTVLQDLAKDNVLLAY